MLIRTTKKPAPGDPIRSALTGNHTETLLGRPIRAALTANHSETLLGRS